MYKTWQKTGKVTYYYSHGLCNQKVVIDDKTDTLPTYPKCHGTSFRK